MAAGVAHIEIARIASTLAGVSGGNLGWLSDSEQARLATIRVDARRRQYLAGHWLARVLLARALGDAPSEWRLLERKGLPPQVQGHDGMKVSISHTADWIAVAVANVAIGIDLEQRPRALDAAIEPLLLNADETAGSLDDDALLQRWVAKEAWIKRDAGSALPARIKRIQLLATTRERADVRIESGDAFHFGLAIVPSCVVSQQCEVSMLQGSGFGVAELES